MLRGAKRVTCPYCGHGFVAFDIEDNATAKSVAVHCPRCGAEVRVDGFRRLLSRVIGLVKKTNNVYGID